MNKLYGNVVLVTGASSGIGKAVSELLMNDGYRVYGTSRKPQEESNIIRAAQGDGFIKMLQLEVGDTESVKKAVEFVMKEEGRISILINNVGMPVAGSVEDVSPEEAYKQFNTNFFGMHRMVRYVVPIMRKQGKGLVINISSVAAQFAIPFQSMYSASKSAIDAVSLALRSEVKPFGINVVLIEPGDVKTNFTASRISVADSGENSAYRDRFTKSVGVMIKDETNGPGPEVVAKEVYRVINRKRPPLRVIIGFQYKLFVCLKRILPIRLETFLLSKMY